MLSFPDIFGTEMQTMHLFRSSFEISLAIGLIDNHDPIQSLSTSIRYVTINIICTRVVLLVNYIQANVKGF